MTTVAAVCTDVGGWRAVRPAVDVLTPRGHTVIHFHGGPAHQHATAEGYESHPVSLDSPYEAARQITASGAAALLVGTSTRPVIERWLVREMRGTIPSVGVLDASLFAAHRFRPAFLELPDRLACPDPETAEALGQGGAPRERLAVTGNPAIEALVPSATPRRPASSQLDVLFVSQPVELTGEERSLFLIDERETLAHVIQALGMVRTHRGGSVRIRIRRHPIEEPWRCMPLAEGIAVVDDPHADRVVSALAADLVVGISSSLLTEASVLGRPAIAHLPGAHWRRELVYPATHRVVRTETVEQLIAAIDERIDGRAETMDVRAHVGAARAVAQLVLDAAARAMRG
ncbi:MAG: hypothetical protein U0821_17095 [Chloroflexota bacterium]